MRSLTLPAVLEASARAHAGRPALSMVNGEPLTYSALLTRVRSAASLLPVSYTHLTLPTN